MTPLASLKRNGVLVVNLLSRDKRFHDYMSRIENSFNGRLASVMVEPHGNVIVFAFPYSPGKRVGKTRVARTRSRNRTPFALHPVCHQATAEQSRMNFVHPSSAMPLRAV